MRKGTKECGVGLMCYKKGARCLYRNFISVVMAKEKYASTPREEPTSSDLGITKKGRRLCLKSSLGGSYRVARVKKGFKLFA